MLTIENLHVHYGTTHAVRGVSLTVPDADTVALLGPNSAGKSSILNAISGLSPYEGRIAFDGTDLTGMRPERRARAGLIQVPEGRRMIGTLTVHENLLLGMTAQAGRTPVFRLEDVYALFPMLADMTKRPSWTLSGGQQQMVAVGRALVAASAHARRALAGPVTAGGQGGLQRTAQDLRRGAAAPRRAELQCRPRPVLVGDGDPDRAHRLPGHARAGS